MAKFANLNAGGPVRVKVRFAGLLMLLPDGWCDITDDRPGSTATLARDDGVGALQFTLALYKSGAKPKVGKQDLLGLLSEFSAGERGPPRNVQEGQGENGYVVGDFRWDGWFMRAWYVSNGSDIAFVTYTTEEPLGDVAVAELRDVGMLIESLSF